MNPDDFNGLLESVRHAGEIKRGKGGLVRKRIRCSAQRQAEREYVKF